MPGGVAFSFMVRKFQAAFVVVFLCAALSGALAVDWPSYQGDVEHTGLSSAQIDVPSLSVAWTAPTGYDSPLIVGNTVYATKGSESISGTVSLGVSAFDLNTGAIKWTYSGTFDAASRAGVGAGLVVFVGRPLDSNPTGLASVYVLNATTGAVLYTVPLGTGLSSLLMPIIAQDPLTGSVTAYCVANSSVSAVLLGPTTGSLLWTRTASFGGSGLPTLVAGSIILAGPGQYYAFDRLTGATNHFYTSNTFGGGGATVAYDASRKQFYVVESYGDLGTPTLSAYHYSDNDHINLLWQRTGEAVDTGAGAAIGPTGNVYLARFNEMIEIDPASGAILRRIFADFSAGMSPAISNGVLWAYSHSVFGSTYAYDLGTLQLTRTLPGSRGSLNTAYDGPGAICDNHFLLDRGSSGFVVYAAPGPVHLSGVVSRIVHGSAGPFDVNLPLTGGPGVECRSGGADGDFTLVFTLTNPVASVATVGITHGVGSIKASAIDPDDPRNYIVNLTGVANAQAITIALTNVKDVQGGSTPQLSATMGVLEGDTNGDGFVNANDVMQTKSYSGSGVLSTNFRADVTANGVINASDVSVIKSLSGTGLL